MRFRHTILCLAVILSCLTQGSDTAHGQSPALLDAQNRYTTLYQQGRYSEAITYAAEALRLGEEEFGPDHPNTATFLDYLAQLYHRQGNYAEAAPLYRRSLAIDEKALGPEHPSVATTLENYAALLRKTGRADEAAEMEARAKSIRAKYEPTFGPERQQCGGQRP